MTTRNIIEKALRHKGTQWRERPLSGRPEGPPVDSTYFRAISRTGFQIPPAASEL